MTPERWQRIKDVLGLTLHRPAGERTLVIAEACGADLSLRREVTELLQSHDSMGSFLELSDAPAGEEETPAELRSWDRFQIAERLGAGGMAVVYKAWDPRLRRFVAIKIISEKDELTVKRFLREAETQARVDHENVAKVYETGVVGPYHYIAMQYVNGPALMGIRDETTLEQKLDLLIRIAEGLQAAHRKGLVHRDIKPGNILVERTAEGLKPYLLDFGLAVDVGAPSVTKTGVVIGTPRYMAPERIHGGAGTLDRRSDVYSLGATFYELVSGAAPFAGSSSLQVLVDVLKSDVVPLRVVQASVPPEIDAIVMKCLERDPAERYPSARALAEDVRRYLDGEPVQARRSGILVNLSRKMRRHPRLSLAFAALSVLILTLAGWGGYTSWQARRERDLAQRLGQEVRDVEWLFRAGQMSPLHPIEGQKREVRRRLGEIRRIMNDLGSIAVGPGHYALGRGLLTLGETTDALRHLQQAWDSGYRTPDAAAALGLTHSEIYRVEMAKARRIGRDHERERRIRELESANRDRALFFFRHGSSSTIVPSRYVASLIASLRGDVPRALAEAERAAQETPWLFEARLLQGHLRFEHAVGLYLKHDAGAVAMARRADDDYARAEAIAKSAADPHIGRCAVAGLLIHMALHRFPADGTSAHRQAEESCARALVVEPASAAGHRLFAEAAAFWANLLVRDGGDPGDGYERASKLAARAIALAKDDPDPILAMGEILLDRAWWESKHGHDPRTAVAQAVATFEKALAIDPRNPTGANNMGMALGLRAKYEAAKGLDASDAQNRSIASYQRALSVDPEFAFTYRNLSRAAISRADTQAGKAIDPRPALGQVIRSLEELPGNPAFPARAEALTALRARLEKADLR